MKKLLIALFLTFHLSGCATGTLVDAQPTNNTYSVNAKKNKVFDAALVVAQSLNLNVALIEKDSGFIKFENATLSAHQLDEYCNFMAQNAEGAAWDTFINWNKRSVDGGAGYVRGSAQITYLVLDQNGKSAINSKSIFSAFNNSEKHQCSSKGVLENELIQKIEAHLSSPLKAAESSFTQGDDKYSRLETISRLRDDKILTESEFQKEKAKILSE